jgi:AcrR family transcriptional regulator
VTLEKMSAVREEARPAARQRLSKDERRTRILDAAAQVFADRGYEPATLDEIAEAAGISKPVIYDHFSSKKELHISLIESHGQALLEFMAERVGRADNPADALAAGLGALLEFVERDPYAWRLLFQEPSATDVEIVEAHRENQSRTTAAIAGFAAAQPFEVLPDDPVGRDVALELIAQMIKMSGAGVVTWWYEHRDVGREELLEMLMNTLWVGLERVMAGARWRQQRPDG